MRLIDADALDIFLENAELKARKKKKYVLASALNTIRGNIRKFPSAQTKQRWIPCSESLPEEGERVLATHLGGVNPDRQVIEHIYENGKFLLGWDMDLNIDSPTFGQRLMGEVIAWMPVPEPYEVGRHE